MRVYYNKSVEFFLQEAEKTVKNPIAYFLIHKAAEGNISYFDVAEEDKVICSPEVRVKKMYMEEAKDKMSWDEYVDSLQADKRSPGYTKNRIEIRMGRLLKKIIEENRSYWDGFISRWRGYYDEKRTEDELVEELVKQYRAVTKKIFDKEFDTRIELVTGSDIKKWYNQQTYKSGNGSLHKSCMRGSGCSEFFEIYEKNPDVCGLLIFKDSSSTISMRALVWKLPDGKRYLDRIYSSAETDNVIFINYAKRNGWLSFDYSNRNDLKLQVKNQSYNRFPYMDSFQWLNRSTGLLSVSKVDTEQVRLTDTAGSYRTS